MTDRRALIESGFGLNDGSEAIIHRVEEDGRGPACGTNASLRRAEPQTARAATTRPCRDCAAVAARSDGGVVTGRRRRQPGIMTGIVDEASRTWAAASDLEKTIMLGSAVAGVGLLLLVL